MNCTRCEYPLWNLRTRVCPECGEPFAPSSFRFAQNSVRFCCPGCGQAYYGTDEQGHLVPRTFACVSCRRRVDMDEMVLLPTEGVEERLTRPDMNPWLEERGSILLRWLRCGARGAAAPVWLMRATPVSSGSERAWGFVLLTHLLIGLVLCAPVCVLSLAGGGSGMAAFFLGPTLIAIVATLVGLGLWIASAHALLRIGGGATQGGMGRTAHALCYTCLPNAALLVPCLGVYMGWIGTLWWMISAAVALTAAQRVSATRAAIAVGALPAVIAAALIAGGVVWVSGTIRTVGAAPANAAATGGNVQAFAVLFRARSATGVWPAHAAELLERGLLEPSDFIATMSATEIGDCPLLDRPLPEWDSMSPQEQSVLVGAAAAALPEGVVAHRLGDFVFTWHGMDAADPARELWLVIESWDPDAPHQSEQLEIAVLTADGAVLTIPADLFGAARSVQNRVRADRGLPPLPDPLTVLHGSPAVARPADGGGGGG